MLGEGRHLSFNALHEPHVAVPLHHACRRRGAKSVVPLEVQDPPEPDLRLRTPQSRNCSIRGRRDRSTPPLAAPTLSQVRS